MTAQKEYSKDYKPIDMLAVAAAREVNDGDIVVMRPITQAENGEMVAVWLADRDETTLKYFYKEGGHIRLQPANPLMKPIIIDNPAQVQVQGKVVLVIRRMGSA